MPGTILGCKLSRHACRLLPPLFLSPLGTQGGCPGGNEGFLIGDFDCVACGIARPNDTVGSGQVTRSCGHGPCTAEEPGDVDQQEIHSTHCTAARSGTSPAPRAHGAGPWKLLLFGSNIQTPVTTNEGYWHCPAPVRSQAWHLSPRISASPLSLVLSLQTLKLGTTWSNTISQFLAGPNQPVPAQAMQWSTKPTALRLLMHVHGLTCPHMTSTTTHFATSRVDPNNQWLVRTGC
jgi:hypothetical protein